MDLVHLGLKEKHLLRGQDGLHLIQKPIELRRLHQNPALGVLTRVPDGEAEEEAVELTLREGVGPVVLQGILGRKDEEWARQLKGLVVDGDPPFLHRLQESALGSRRSTVDLVGQEDVRKDRSRPRLELAGLRVEEGDTQHVRGQEIAGELNPSEGEAQGPGQRVCQRCLAHSGHVLEEDVPPGQEGGDGQAHHLPLPVEYDLYLIYDAIQEGQVGHDSVERLRLGDRHSGLGAGVKACG
jgi:hypothetical protein